MNKNSKRILQCGENGFELTDSVGLGLKIMKKKRKSLIFRLAVCACAAYIAVTLVYQVTQIQTRSAQLATLKTQVAQQQKQNTETQRLLSEKDEQFMQSVAENDLGYAKPNERIFVDASGN